MCILNTHIAPQIALGTGDAMMNKTIAIPALLLNLKIIYVPN